MKKILTLTLPATLTILLILELVFRFIIPASQQPYYEMKKEGEYYIGKYNELNGKRGQSTFSAFAQIKGRWSINNHGWNNLIDYNYQKDSTKKRICIIGDSFVEALNLDAEQSFVHQLQLKLGEDYQVYSFGIGGSPLSQYVYYARYVTDYYEPDLLIVNIVHNDFDESLINKGDRRNMLFNYSNDSILEINPIIYNSTSKFKRLAVKFASARYLYYNLQIGRFFRFFRLKRIRNKKAEETNEQNDIPPSIELNDVLAQKDVDKILTEEKVIEEVVDYSINEIIETNLSRPVIFLMDGARKDLLKEKESELTWLNSLVVSTCEKKSIPIIDLQPIFKDYFNGLNEKKIKRKRTMTQIDSHWDEEEHQIVADTLLRAIQNFKIN